MSVSVGHTFRPIKAFTNVDFPLLNSPQTRIVVGFCAIASKDFFISAIFFPFCDCTILLDTDAIASFNILYSFSNMLIILF